MSSHPTESICSGAGGDSDRWDLRIARARELAAQYPSATQILTFYGGLADFQRSLCRHPTQVRATTPDFVDSVDLDAASAAVPDLLVWLQRTAPERLARDAIGISDLAPSEWRELMCQFLTPHDDDIAGVSEAMAFVVEALLQPFAEAAAIHRRDDERVKWRASQVRPSRCPICASSPGLGVLREAGHGGKRMLACALCLSEWEFLRVVCPACDEQRFDALPVYTSEAFAHVRVEACDSCGRYLKTIDLTKNGLAVPLVDDLASVPLDLWARGQGYRRIRGSLLRTG